MLLIKNGRILDPSANLDFSGDLAADGGRIIHIYRHPEHSPVPEEAFDEVIDASSMTVSPGFVDAHSHFRDPGFTHKETLHTGALAAAAGGYTSVILMANTSPAVDSPEILSDILHRAREEQIHIYQTAAVTRGRKGKELNDLEALLKAGAAGFTDDGSPLLDPDLTALAMKEASRLDSILSFHEEDPAFIGTPGINEGSAAERLGLKGAGRRAEYSMVERDLDLALKYRCRIDIQHVSAAESVELIRTAKRKDPEGLIHAEATPNHFSLTEEAVDRFQTLVKVNPPLRTEADRQALIRGLTDQTLDMIATDHAPHTAEEKARPFPKAPSGITGLETSLSLGLEYLVNPGFMDLSCLIRLMSSNPARIWRLPGGTLREGSPADITIFSDKETSEGRQTKSLSSNSPFLGLKLPGVIHYTICGGKVVFRQ